MGAVLARRHSLKLPSFVVEPPGPDDPLAWAAPTVRDALGLWNGGNAVQSDWDNYMTFIGGTELKFRLAFMAAAADTTWTTKTTAFTTLTNRATTSSMFHANNTPNVTCVCTIALCLNGQSLSTAAYTTANRAFWRGLADLAVSRDFDVRYVDGRPQIVFRVGHEANAKAFFPWRYADDYAKALAYHDAMIQARAWFEERVVELGGDPTAFDWAANITGRRGSSATDGIHTAADLVIAAFPGAGWILEIDAYDYSGYFVGKTASQKVAQRQTVQWERSGKSTTGTFTTNGQGLDLVAALGESLNVLVAVAETSVTHTNGAVNEAEGGDDDPDWIEFMHGWASDRVDEGRLAYFIDYDDDVDDTGLFHRKRTGSVYNFPLARAKHLELFAA